MFRSGKLVSALGSAAILLALVGCSAGDPEPTSDPTEASDASEDFPEGSDDTGCLVDRVWHLDVPDLAGQLAAQLQSTGMPVVSSEGTGQMTFIFSEDTLATTEGDVTFTVGVQQPDAPAMTVSQRQLGSAYGSWLWDGATPNLMAFEDWESTFTVDLTVSIEGTSVDIPLELPDPVAGGVNMTTTCVGDTLATNAEGSPFTQFWTTTD